MCGIAGIVGTEGHAPTAADIELMINTLQPRGPDYLDTWLNEHLALGHTRLSIIDLDARANQPFFTTDGDGVLVYNGELYNYLELRDKLSNSGVEFRTECDTEVVLMALHTWGPEQAVKAFDGMLAFAYVDRRDNSVWLGRDRLGIKPLFTAQLGDGLLFASEQKAILAHPDFDAVMDEQSMMALLTYERFNDTETPYKNISNFQPGHLLHINPQGRRLICYYDPIQDSRIEDMQKTDRSLDETSRQFNASLEASVHAHLMSDVPVAVLCSGGLDSGVVTAMAARHKPDLVAYVGDLHGMHGEEYRRAKLVTDHLGLELQRVPIGPQEFLKALPGAIQANDQPLFFAQEVALFVIAAQMRADGFKVCLSGDGADELFGGYPWQAEAYDHWYRLARKARLIPDNALFKRLGKLWSKLAPVDVERQISRYNLTFTHIEYVATSFNAVVTAGMNRTMRQRKLFEHFAELPLAERAFQAANFEDVYVHMRESLNAKDKVMMGHSIESRPPFIENAMMELGFNLPVSHKYNGQQRKTLVNRTAAQWLPASVLDLPKIGFRIPSELWQGIAPRFLKDGLLADFLKWPREYMDDAINLLNVRPYYQFRLICTEVWLRQFLEGKSAEELADQLLHLADA